MTSDAVTPMMAQYLTIKAAHPDALLFYRMGDFYELFFDDAVQAAAALDIALTRRGKHLGEDIPMCGVPVHNATGYLDTLIKKGFRVAVCEQTEDAADARRRKAPVARAVARIVTAGTVVEETLLDPRAHSHLCAYAELRGAAALARVDLSTGVVAVARIEPAGLSAELARLAPREVLLRAPHPAVAESGAIATELGAASFESTAAVGRLCALYGVASLEAFGAFERVELSALGALADYIATTQVGRMPTLRPPLRETPGGVMRIDAATRANLELTRGPGGAREGGLLATIDRTRTGAGARLLAARLGAPLTDPALIAARQDETAVFVADRALAGAVRTALAAVPDIERALMRLGLDRGGPRDLGAVRAGLTQAARIADLVGDALPFAAALTGFGPLVAHLDAALVAEPPPLARDGGFVAAGFDAELDQTRDLRDQGRGVIAGLQAGYAAEVGIATLKIRHNHVLGYYVEVGAAHAERMLAPPLNARFIHRQTLPQAVRFTTLDLADLEARILNASGRALELELAVFAALRAAVLARQAEIGAAAEALARLDVAAAAAELVAAEGWVRPLVTGDRAFQITAGRHPVVEAALARQGASFVANDLDLSGGAEGPAPIWLVTGPNMAGKSTFLRQAALIAILAQSGLPVPAATAKIGVVDQVFSRVGAADDLARGRSTFMVEMVETAAILNQAGPRALVILDEIGRGTATYDGLSIAWATLEHLHDVNRCRGLFATHYHELGALTGRLALLRPATVAVREWQGDLVFLHEVRPGAADRSYGVQVARLAGLPPRVVARARAVLAELEATERGGPITLDQLPLFAARPTPPAPPPPPAEPPLVARLRALDPDALTPREALEVLYALVAEARGTAAGPAGVSRPGGTG